MSPPFLTAPALHAPGVVHGFFGRQGGVSAGIYAALNAGFGSQDDAKAVAENRRRVAAALGLGPTTLLTPYQVHGAQVERVGPAGLADRPHCDGLVTTEPGLPLSILTADCAPIMLLDPHNRVIGAAHAGWKGLLAGIIPAIVAAMLNAGAERGRICAAIGPCIGQGSYEVGPEFMARFVEHERSTQRFFYAGRGDRSLFDLSGACAAQLEAEGLHPVHQIGADTCALEAEFFSNRRALLRGEADYGRNISVIVLTRDL